MMICIPTDLSAFFPRALLKLKGGRAAWLGDKSVRSRLYQARARARVSFVRKSRLAGAGSLARRATGLHFHGARLADAYCIYLLTSKVNLPAPVHELYAHIRALAYQPDGRTQRPRARACTSQRLQPAGEQRAREACRKFRARARARRLRGIHFSNAHDE